jgi:hypothetical protein
MGELLAILTAIAFAFGTVLQQKGAMSTRAGEKDAHGFWSRSSTSPCGSPG